MKTRGSCFAQILMPTGATLEQTQAVADEVRHYFQENEKDAVESCMTIAGVGFSGRAQNNGMVFVKLKDWKLREPAGFEGQGRCRPGHGGVFQNPQRHSLCLPASPRRRDG